MQSELWVEFGATCCRRRTGLGAEDSNGHNVIECGGDLVEGDFDHHDGILAVVLLLVTLVCYALAAATAPHGAGNLLEPMPSFASFMFAGFVVAPIATAGSCLLSIVLTW